MIHEYLAAHPIVHAYVLAFLKGAGSGLAADLGNFIRVHQPKGFADWKAFKVSPALYHALFGGLGGLAVRAGWPWLTALLGGL